MIDQLPTHLFSASEIISAMLLNMSYHVVTRLTKSFNSLILFCCLLSLKEALKVKSGNIAQLWDLHYIVYANY